MAKKKRKNRPNQFRPFRKRPPTRTPDPVPPDQRAFEASLHDLVGDRPAPGTPQRQAQDLLDRAFRERNPTSRVELARQALSHWPDCADALVLLAENSSSRSQELNYYRQAVEAAERVLGPDGFREAAGRYWGYLPTRPYMRARLGLAISLWTAGQRQEAIGHAQELLRLNPNDNQGIRYTLGGFLLACDRDDDLNRLLEQFPGEGSASWAYTKALLGFRREGDTPDNRRLLKMAKRANLYVPDYLTGRKMPPPGQPDHYTHGDENDALIYLNGSLTGWKNTAGAVAWVRANDEQFRKEQARVVAPVGPLGFVKSWLNRHLSQQDDVWQVEFRRTPKWATFGGFPARLWLTLVMSRTMSQVLGHQLSHEEPQSARLWDTLLRAMQHPLVGDAHRPTEIQVRQDSRWQDLAPHLEEVGIRLTVTESLDLLDVSFEELNERLAGEPEPGLLSDPNIRPEQMARFYEAAAVYFEKAPWREVGYESAIVVRCDRFRGGVRYAVVMGQSGLTHGLALYEDLGRLRELWANDRDETVATSVIFGEEWHIPVPDADAARRYQWKVARPDAYPSAMRKDRRGVRLAEAWELEILEASLLAVAEHTKRRRQDDTTPEEIVVRLGTEEVRLVLAWVRPDDA